MPDLSVIMPVYNGEIYLCQAIDSILKQTFRDFEFIIIDDASTDGSSMIINTYKDPRIKFIRNTDNRGNYPSRNIGLEIAVGKLRILIALMCNFIIWKVILMFML